MDLFSLEADLVFPVHGIDVVLDVLELELGQGEDDLGHVLPANRTLVPLAQDPHPGAAHVADGVVALAHAPHLDTVHADLTEVLRGSVSLRHFTDLSLPDGNVHLGWLLFSLVTVTVLVTLKRKCLLITILYSE